MGVDCLEYNNVEYIFFMLRLEIYNDRRIHGNERATEWFFAEFSPVYDIVVTQIKEYCVHNTYIIVHLYTKLYIYLDIIIRIHIYTPRSTVRFVAALPQHMKMTKLWSQRVVRKRESENQVGTRIQQILHKLLFITTNSRTARASGVAGLFWKFSLWNKSQYSLFHGFGNVE